MASRWLFGYGSIIWRPGFAHHEARVARVDGWVRRFWQGSHDHRGVPEAPGRVVTLVRDRTGYVEGVAYRVDDDAGLFARLDHREKNGYGLTDITLRFRDGRETGGCVYIAPRDNHAFLGPASPQEMAVQIATCAGPERNQPGLRASPRAGAARARHRRPPRLRSRAKGARCGASAARRRPTSVQRTVNGLSLALSDSEC